MSTTEMLDKVKAALLDCEAKSVQLEEAGRQLTVQKLRSQLAIETRLVSLEQQLKTAGKQLLAELASHHDSWQAKIHQQEHLVLKCNMQLSSALAKDMVSPALLSKLEDNMVTDLAGLRAHFRPSDKLEAITKSEIGFIQLGHHLPSQVILSMGTFSMSEDNNKLITCVLSSNQSSHFHSLKQFLKLTVVREQEETVEHQLEEEKTSKSHTLKIIFAAKSGGRYCVTVTMYGEMVQGSPMVVEVDECTIITSEAEENNNVKLDGDGCDTAFTKLIEYISDTEELVKEDIKRRKEAPKVKVGEGDGRMDLAVDFSGDMFCATIEDLPRTETRSVTVSNDLSDVDDDTNDKVVDANAGVDLCRTASLPATSPPGYRTQLDKEADHTGSEALVAPDTKFTEGSFCLALWSKDSVWYRARVDSVTKGLYQVTFIDYVNTVAVSPENMVARMEDIPKDQLEMVDLMVWKWSVGMSCIAKWSEDNSWYNGVVSAVCGGQYTVLFSDYGNMEVVSEENIVETAKDIPIGEIVDLCVNIIEELEKIESSEQIIDASEAMENIIDIEDVSADSCLTPQSPTNNSQVVTTLVAVEEDKSEGIHPHASPQTVVNEEEDDHVALISKFEVGSCYIAQWSQDSTWYNGMVIMVNSDGSCQMEFVDYGNVETVNADKIVENVEDIPTGSIVDEWVKSGNVELEVTSGLVEMARMENLKGKEEIDMKHENLTSLGLKETVKNEEEQLPKGDNAKKEKVSTMTIAKDTKMAEVKIKNSPDVERPDQDDNNLASPVEPHSQVVDAADWSPTAGSQCLAKWTDRVWYNARVDQVLGGGKEVFVTFTDYGNTDKVQVRKLARDHKCIPKGAKVNVHVQQEEMPIVPIDDQVDQDPGKVHVEHALQVTSPTSPPSPPPVQDGLGEGDQCVALWAEDNIWYNARILKIDQQDKVADVEFFDYGNIDKVSLGNIYRSFTSVLLLIPGEEITVDPHVRTGYEDVADPVSLLSLVSTDQHGKMMLNAVVVNTISNMEGVVGMAVLQDGTLITALEKENLVKMWSRDGECTVVVGERKIQQPSDVVSMGSAGFAVRDKKGIMIFNMQGKYVKSLKVDKLDTNCGMAVDNLGRIVVINKCLGEDEGRLTVRGETDILYIDMEKEKVVKRVEMIDIIADRVKTDCKALTMHKDKLYVVDTGLDCIYTLFHEEGEDKAEVFGSPGRRETQFSGVSSVIVDDDGNMVISDTRNNRLQLISREWEFVGFVKVQPSPLSRPSTMCLDREVGQLVVHNMGSADVVRYSLG